MENETPQSKKKPVLRCEPVVTEINDQKADKKSDTVNPNQTSSGGTAAGSGTAGGGAAGGGIVGGSTENIDRKDILKNGDVEHEFKRKGAAIGYGDLPEEK